MLLRLEEEFALTGIRVIFNRGDEVKFISHLDLMKAFERTMRRTGLPVAYSQGFNPHPQMVFGLPLSVGITSEAECADLMFAQDVTPEYVMEKLNQELPKGLFIKKAGIKISKANIMAEISAAQYKVVLEKSTDLSQERLETDINSILAQNTVIVLKETKNGSKELDIRPMLFDAKITSCDEVSFCLTVLLSAGSQANVKPELFMAALSKYSGFAYKVMNIHRTGLYVGQGGLLKHPLDEKVLNGAKGGHDG